MKKKIFSAVVTVLSVVFSAITLFACESVAPAAWVQFKTDDGYVYYTTYMYATSHGHIVYYASEEDAEKAADKTNFGSYDILTITFSPRILGPEVKDDGERSTLVDIKSWYEMQVDINKTHEDYSADKKIYLNGKVLEPYNTYDSEYLTILHFKNFTLVRGNPNGQRNDVINFIEYK